ncbi:MAG TPA: FAD-dependent oxidoreductase [Gemmatimonadales bacterium]|jgi:thioredoxin reductase (NADPH)
MITAEDLTNISLFAAVPASERKSIAECAADVRLDPGEWLLVEGQAAAFYGLLEGGIDVFKSVGGRDLKISSYGPGDYFGEVPLMLGAPALASLQATAPSRLMRLEPKDFHSLVTECRVLGGEISKTMLDRVSRLRKLTVETPQCSAIVTGHRLDPDCYDLRKFLSLNHIPFEWNELDGAHEGTTFAPPILEVPDEHDKKRKHRFEKPTYRQAADALGLQTEPKPDAYDVVIVGGGPAGLGAAVYGASEGLRTLLIERTAFGGQAGTSSRIENYLGFPAGLSGEELSDRACRQATKFGAELVVARSVERLDPGDPSSGVSHTVVLDGGTTVEARAVILATGVEWRKLEMEGIEQLTGKGVYYGAGSAEARRFQGKDVCLVGGGNSAGQAAMRLSDYAETVTMLVRGRTLAASMSQYLVEQLEKKKNVSIEYHAECVRLVGDTTLQAIEVARGPSRAVQRRDCHGLFIFIGARAETDWLPQSLIRDEWGFICTGRDVMDLLRERAAGTWPLERDPFMLETSIPGVLAAGDVRHGSIKRCSAGVGDGSMAVAVVHQILGEARDPRAAAAMAGRGQ